MKAIVNVNKKSAYAKYNGLTFEVELVLSQQVVLSIINSDFSDTKPITTDFGHSEVLIVDIKQEIKQLTLDVETAIRRMSRNPQLEIDLQNLHSYCKKNKIQL